MEAFEIKIPVRIYLITDSGYPTIHRNIHYAKKYISELRKERNVSAMYAEFTYKDLKEGFCNRRFYSI